MDDEKCPSYASPNSVVTPDIGTPDPTPSRRGDAGLQHGGTGMTPDNGPDEVQNGELWTVDWWDETQEDRSKS